MDESAAELERFATTYRDGDVVVRKAHATFDSQLDGEPVTRLALLLDDPVGETWEFAALRAFERQVRVKAVELELPWVSMTYVPVSEAYLVPAFGA